MACRVAFAITQFSKTLFCGLEVNSTAFDNSVKECFTADIVLLHTPVVTLHRDTDGAVLSKQLAFSSKYSPFGLVMPDCPKCDSREHVTAFSKDRWNGVTISCALCNSKLSVKRPVGHASVGSYSSPATNGRFFRCDWPAPILSWMS